MYVPHDLLIFIMSLEVKDYQCHSPNVLNRSCRCQICVLCDVPNFVAFQKRRKDE